MTTSQLHQKNGGFPYRCGAQKGAGKTRLGDSGGMIRSPWFKKAGRAGGGGEMRGPQGSGLGNQRKGQHWKTSG